MVGPVHQHIASIVLSISVRILCAPASSSVADPALRRCAGTLMETLTEVSVGAAVAAEAGQWRWAWSTDAVLARLRRMRGDLKRAFAAVEDAAPKPAIESITVRRRG